MRLIGFDTFAGLKDGVVPKIEAVLRPARAYLDRLTPIQRYLATKIAEQPTLSRAIGSVAGVWTTLVTSFCAMIEPFVSRYFPTTRLVAVATPSGDVELHNVFRGAVTSYGSLAAIDPVKRAEIAKCKWTAIELRLRSDQLLQRSLSLPTASRDYLAPIIEHKLERLTPWRPDRVLYGYQVHPDGEAGSVTVVLTATSKDFITAPIQILAEAGLVPTAIGAREENLSEPLHLNLLRATQSGARADLQRFVSRSAVAVFSILIVAYAGSSYWASNANDEQHEAGVRLVKARRLLKMASMGAIGERERSLLESKQPEKAMVVFVDKLAQAIPDDTFLKEFNVTPEKMRLAGSSANAPALIGKLETIGLVNVRFAAAVTREKDQRDSFEITADQPLRKEADTR